MRFAAASLLSLLAGSALAAPAAKKPNNSDAIVADIGTISNSLTTLNNTLNTFKPFAVLGVATALKIQSQANALSKVIQTTINDVQSSSKFGDDGSTNVAIATLNLVDPINSTLTNIVAHKPAFATGVLLVGDLSKTVESLLISQRNLTATLGSGIQDRLGSPYNALAPQYIAEILGFFDTAIAKYKTCSGVLCLPPI